MPLNAVKVDISLSFLLFTRFWNQGVRSADVRMRFPLLEAWRTTLLMFTSTTSGSMWWVIWSDKSLLFVLFSVQICLIFCRISVVMMVCSATIKTVERRSARKSNWRFTRASTQRSFPLSKCFLGMPLFALFTLLFLLFGCWSIPVLTDVTLRTVTRNFPPLKI